MTQEIEIEFKNLLTKSEFDYLLTHLPFPKVGKKQVNYYFETDDLSLSKNNCALRIREKNNDYMLTLKEPYETGLLESHASLSKNETLESIKGTIVEKELIKNRLAIFNIKCHELTYVGSLTTIRREFKYDNVLLVLDFSTYNNTSDYELELEAPTESIGANIFNKLLLEHSIVPKHTPSKIERFFATMT